MNMKTGQKEGRVAGQPGAPLKPSLQTSVFEPRSPIGPLSAQPVLAAIPRPALPEGCQPITEFKEEDIFVVGYPKSGNTWVQCLLAGAIYGVDLELAPDSQVQELIPDVHGKRFYRRHSSPVVFKYHGLPVPEYKRVVYLFRDGRDVMVSYWHHLQAANASEIDFLKVVQTGEGLFPCKWEDHVRQWLANPYESRMLFVRYEDLQRDPVRELRLILNFAGVERDLTVLRRAAEKASFAVMQAREKRFGWENSQWPKDKTFIHRGAVGSYADEMPLPVQEAFLMETSNLLGELGYLARSASRAAAWLIRRGPSAAADSEAAPWSNWGAGTLLVSGALLQGVKNVLRRYCLRPLTIGL